MTSLLRSVTACLAALIILTGCSGLLLFLLPPEPSIALLALITFLLALLTALLYLWHLQRHHHRPLLGAIERLSTFVRPQVARSGRRRTAAARARFGSPVTSR